MVEKIRYVGRMFFLSFFFWWGGGGVLTANTCLTPFVAISACISCIAETASDLPFNAGV